MTAPWRRKRWYWREHKLLKDALIGAAIGAALGLLGLISPLVLFCWLPPALLAEALGIRLWNGDMPRSVPLLFLWNAAIYALLGAGVGAVVGMVRESRPFQRRRRAVRGPPRCAKCGYNLTGNVSGICPECGTPIRGGGT